MSDSKTPDGNPGKGEKKEVEVRYVPVEYMDHGHQSEDEISLIDLIKMIWEGRYIVVVTAIIFFLLGIFIYLFEEKQYTSEAVMIQEQQQQQIPGNFLLQQFGGGAMNFQQEGIPSSLYPQIIQSNDFLLGVVYHEVEFEGLGTKMTPLTYFNNYYKPPLTRRAYNFTLNYTIKLPVTIYRGIRAVFRKDAEIQETESNVNISTDERFLILTQQERRAVDMIRNRITLELGGGLATFTVSMPDAIAAAELNEYVIDRIQKYVIDTRINKFQENLRFVEIQKEDARLRYEEAQLELARFRDQNINITTAVARTEQEDLQNRRNVTFNIYNNLAQELEQARTRLQEETPVFNILQKPRLPHTTDSNSPVLLVFLTLLGVFIGIVFIFAGKVWSNVVRSIES